MRFSPKNLRLFSVEPESGISAEDCNLLRLALHRHSDMLMSTGLHSHRHHQILVYLRGEGAVRIEDTTHEVSAGTILLLPAKCAHEFQRHSRRNPLCLVIDFRHTTKLTIQIRRQGNFRTSLLRRLINELSYLKNAATAGERLQRDGLALQLLGVCLDGLLQQKQTTSRHPVNLLFRMENLIQNAEHSQLTLSDAAAQSGYQKDYLNRILKQQSGMSFGQLRAEMRLRRVQTALAQSHSVADAAARAGFDDVNYFIRWFRKQTGRTPGNILREHRKLTGRESLP